MTTTAKGPTSATDVFRALRRAGLAARQRFMCCGSCACSTFEFERSEGKHEGKIGYVFYHKQEAERFDKSGQVYLYYYAFSKKGEKHVAERRRQQAVGKVIAETLTKAGWHHGWDGSPDHAILTWDAVALRLRTLHYLGSAR